MLNQKMSYTFLTPTEIEALDEEMLDSLIQNEINDIETLFKATKQKLKERHAHMPA